MKNYLVLSPKNLIIYTIYSYIEVEAIYTLSVGICWNYQNKKVWILED